MRYSFIIILLFYLYPAYSQRSIVVNDTNTKNKTEIKDPSDIIVCGMSAEAYINLAEWTDYLNKNLVLDDPSLDTIPPGTYKVIIQFVVNSKGKISDVSIWKDAGHGLGERGVNVISQYKGRWHPAELNGQVTRSYLRQLITFIVEKEKEKCEEQLPAEFIL